MKNTNKIWQVPVSWKMCGHIDVPADSFKEAVQYAKDHNDELPCPKDGTYITASMKVDEKKAMDVNNCSGFMYKMNIWLNPSYPQGTLTSYAETNAAYLSKNKRIDTTQICFCSTSTIASGYHLFVHMPSGNVIELKMGGNDCTTRFIRPECNLEKLLLAGEFGSLQPMLTDKSATDTRLPVIRMYATISFKLHGQEMSKTEFIPSFDGSFLFLVPHPATGELIDLSFDFNADSFEINKDELNYGSGKGIFDDPHICDAFDEEYKKLDIGKNDITAKLLASARKIKEFNLVITEGDNEYSLSSPEITEPRISVIMFSDSKYSHRVPDAVLANLNQKIRAAR